MMKLSLQTHVAAAFLNLWAQYAVSSISVPEMDMCKYVNITSQQRNIALAACGDHENKNCTCCIITAENRSVSVTCKTTTPPPDPKLILLPTILGVLALVVIIVCVIYFCNRNKKMAKLQVAPDEIKYSQDGDVYAIPSKITRKPKTTKAKSERRPSESSDEDVHVPVPKKSWETGGDGVKQSKHNPGQARETSTVIVENNIYVPFHSSRRTPAVTREPSTVMVDNDIYVNFHSSPC